MRVEVPALTPTPAPAELRVALDPRVRLLARGRVFAGGSPWRLLSLTEDGARVISDWAVPSPVGGAPGRRRLARRLLDAGMLVPHPAPVRSTSEMTVVVPVRDRPAQLARCLDAVRETYPDSPVIVVDDGSADPRVVEALCAVRGVRVIRHPTSRGPSAARNSGLAAASTPHVGFVDSDVVLPQRSPARLLGHLSDPCVGAVAPRVRALWPGRGVIGGYEERHSLLDMGVRGGLVAPGWATSYVPSAVLLVRRGAVGEGFDESILLGEDVDMVWRLWRGGWRVRYAPEVEVWHDHRQQLRDFISVRYPYARSIGVLARRHASALPAMWVSPPMALTWVLVLSGRRRAAVALTISLVLRTRRRLRAAPLPAYPLAGAIVARGLANTGLALSHELRRGWAPPLLPLAVRRRRLRSVLIAAFATRTAQDLLDTRDLAATLRDIPIRVLDDLLATAGTWDGCLRERTIRPLLPSWRSPGTVAR